MELNKTWSGDVPKEFIKKRFKFCYTYSHAGAVIDKSWWHKGNEILYTCQETPMYSDYDSFPNSLRTKEKDLLLTRNATPYIFIPQLNSIYSNVVQKVTIKTSEYSIPYLRYVLICATDSVQVNGNTIPSWNMGVWDNLYLPIPPLEKQNEIVHYLNNKLDLIDELIDCKTEQVRELENFKYNYINELLTKTSNVARVDSFSSLTKGPFGSDMKKSIFVEKSDYSKKVYIQVNCIQNDETLGDYYITNSYYHEMSRFKVRPKDILISCDGTLGKVVQLSDECEEGVISPSLLRVRLNEDKISSRYFIYCWEYYLLNNLIKDTRNACLVHLPSASLIGRAKIPYLPLEEQNSIVEKIDSFSAKINELITIKKNKIEELNSYKKSLIFECVTGKKEVI